MAKRVVDDASLTGVAETIRSKTGKAEKLMFPEGFSVGVEDVFAAGEKSEYDRFWDAFQNHGNRVLYGFAFAEGGWDDATFRPKYDIVPDATDANSTVSMFNNSHIVDLKGCLERQGVRLDFSNITSMSNPFVWSFIERLPELDCSNSSNVSFYYAYKLKSVDKVIIKANGTTTFNMAGTSELIDIVFAGVIGTSLDMQWSKKLSHNSIENIVNTLSGTTTGRTVTLSLAAVNKAFETAQGAADGSTCVQWASLVATKSNWTVNLV